MKKSILYTILLMMIVSMVLVTPAKASTGTKLVVDQNAANCDDVAGGPFCTIQAAVDAASPGDQIYVKPGLYAGANVTTPQVTLIALGATVQGDIFVLANQVKVTGFQMIGTILSNNTSDLKIVANYVHDSPGTGIYMYNVDNSAITNNVVVNAGFAGIDLRGGSDYNIISLNNITGSFFDGIYLADSSHNRIWLNTSSKNAQNGLSIGNADNRVRWNQFDNNLAGIYDGTTGAGAAGTANYYTNNSCSGNIITPSTPAGLCN